MSKNNIKPDIAWALLVGGAALYELWALVVNKDDGDTLSEAVWNGVTKRPYIPFAVGFLMGHFFWQKEDAYKEVVQKETTTTMKGNETCQS